MDKNDLISVAKILGFHGINGEVRAGYTKGHENKIKSIKNMFLDTGKEMIPLTVQSIRFHKKNALIKFKEMNSINDVEQYKNLLLYVDKDLIADKLDEDEFLVSDLIGIEVYDQNDELVGTVISVADNSATDILSVKSTSNPEKIHLIPFVKALVPVIDLKQKKLLINNIEGLLE